MKKLKKQFLAAVLTAVMAVCAFAGTTPVAAATLSAKQYINKMAKATEKLKSYEMKMNMDIGYGHVGSGKNHIHQNHVNNDCFCQSAENQNRYDDDNPFQR